MLYVDNMSYTIVRSISIQDEKVFIVGASNNVYPRTPNKYESESLSKILKEEGREALDVALLENYDKGNAQGGSNKYTRALTVLRHFPEYSRFDWRNNWEESNKNRGTAEYYDLLRKALKTRLPSDKYVITIMLYDGRKVYFAHRKNARSARWYENKSKATIYQWEEDAKAMVKCFQNSETWQVEKGGPEA